jgi:hypothetical protein
LLSIAWLLGAVFFGYSKMIETRAGKPWLADFTLFYRSAVAFWNNSDLYSLHSVRLVEPMSDDQKRDKERSHPNLNMPLVTALFLPLAVTDITTGMAIWASLSVGFTMVAAWMLGGQLVTEYNGAPFFRWVVSGIIALLLLTYYPTWASANLGQLAQLLFLLLSGAWIAARRKQDRIAGVLFGLAMTLKPFTGLFLLILPWFGRWHLLRWYVGSFAAFLLIGLAAFGPDSYIQYSTVLRQVSWYGAGWNASLLAPVSTILGGGDLPGWYDYPRLAQPIVIIISIALYAALVALIRRLPDVQAKVDLTVAGGIPLMLLASPLGWVYYFLLMWISAIATALAVRLLPSRRRWWISAAMVLVLCGLPFPFVVAAEANTSLRSLLITSADTAALLVAFGFVLAVAWRVSASPRAASV